MTIQINPEYNAHSEEKLQTVEGRLDCEIDNLKSEIKALEQALLSKKILLSELKIIKKG